MHNVLVYHSISSPRKPLPANADVSPQRFATHLRWLARRRVVTLDEVLDTPAQRRLTAISFDDGYRDNLTVALPLIEKYELPVTIFITAGFVGSPGYLSPDEVGILAAHPLVTIGAHGLTHRNFLELNDFEAEQDLTEARRSLERLTGRTVDLMAWPYGACNPHLEQMSAACGYRAAWSVWHGNNTRHSLWRVPLGRPDSLPRLIVKASRAYFPIKRYLKPPFVETGRLSPRHAV